MNRKKASFQATLNHIWVDRELAQTTVFLCQENFHSIDLFEEDVFFQESGIVSGLLSATTKASQALIKSAMKACTYCSNRHNLSELLHSLIHCRVGNVDR